MRCSKCGSEVPPGEVFCPECGIRVSGAAGKDTSEERAPVILDGAVEEAVPEPDGSVPLPVPPAPAVRKATPPPPVPPGPGMPVSSPAATGRAKPPPPVPPAATPSGPPPGGPAAPVVPPATLSGGLRPRYSGLAVAAMVLGILGLIFVLPLIGAVLALIFGFVARGDIKRSDGMVKGSGMAIAGIAMGFVGIFLIVVITAVAIPVGIAVVGPTFTARSNLMTGADAARIYYSEHGDSYRGMDAAVLSEINIEVEFSDAPGDRPNVVYVDAVTPQNARLYCYSSRGDRFVASASGDEWRFVFNIGAYGHWIEEWHGPDYWMD
ncbi:MAG: DUF4190 domain-containing protein [Actinomycetota bacterium]